MKLGMKPDLRHGLLTGLMVFTFSGLSMAEEPAILLTPSVQRIYKVQVGNFMAYEDAQKAKEALSKQFTGLFIAHHEKLYRVQVGAYTSEEKAKSLLQKLQSAGYKVYIESQ